jgi:hypothetical protein
MKLFFLVALRKTNSANILILKFLFPELPGNAFLLFETPSKWYLLGQP